MASREKFKFCIWINGRLIKECKTAKDDACALVRLTKGGNFQAATHYSEPPYSEKLPLTKEIALRWQTSSNNCVAFLSVCMWAYLRKQRFDQEDKLGALSYFVTQVTPDKISAMVLNSAVRGRARELLGMDPNDASKAQLYDMLYHALRISFDSRDNVPKSNAVGSRKRFFNATTILLRRCIAISEKSQKFSEAAAERSLIEKLGALVKDISKEFNIQEKT